MNASTLPVYRFKLVRNRGVAEPVKAGAPHQIANIARDAIGDSPVEVFIAMGLNSQGKVLGVIEVSRGTYDHCTVDPRILFAGLLNMGPVSGFVLAHNHPSGDPTPSAPDVALTRQMKQAGAYLGLRLLDHVIVGSGVAFSSMLANGLLEGVVS